MRFIEKKQKLEYLLEMIEKGRCISYQQVSEKFNCSESTVKRMISELKEEGNNVKYCKIVGKFIIEIG